MHSNNSNQETDDEEADKEKEESKKKDSHGTNSDKETDDEEADNNKSESKRKDSHGTNTNEETDNEEADNKSDGTDLSDSEYVAEGAAAKAPAKFRPFTNGLDLDTVTQDFRFIVEREKEKEFSDWTPSPAFLGIIYRWSGKPKFHYYNDIYNCTEVCAVELGYTILDYIRLRGWIFSRPANASGLNPLEEHIAYR